MTEEYNGPERDEDNQRPRGPLREVEKYINTLEQILQADSDDVSRSLAQYQGDLRQLKQYLQRAITLLDKIEPDKDVELPADIMGAATTALALMYPGAEVARIRFGSLADQISALPVLDESGGYNRYRNDVLGLSSMHQLKLLRERGISFEVVQKDAESPFGSVYAKVHFRTEKYRMRGRRFLGPRGGYIRYPGDVFGISEEQYRKLKRRQWWIKFDVVE